MLHSIFQQVKALFIKDELCGLWNSDDGSGFMMIMGSWMKIRSNGTGEYESWSGGNDDTAYQIKGEFNWRRINENRIAIQEKGSAETEEIEYSLKHHQGRIELTSKQQALGKYGIEAFWNFAQILFKVN